MIELKPCPFCGGDVDLVHENDYVSISCGQCGIMTDFYPSADALSDVWNSRVSDGTQYKGGSIDTWQ